MSNSSESSNHLYYHEGKVHVWNIPKRKSSYTNFNQIADELESNAVDLNDIRTIFAPFGNLTSLKGIERFSTLNSLDIRDNEINEISINEINIITKLFANSKGVIEYPGNLYYASAEDFGHVYGENEFLIFVQNNPISDVLLNKLQIQNQELNNLDNQNYVLTESLTYLVDKAIETFNFSEKSIRLKQKYSSFNSFLETVVKGNEESPLAYMDRYKLERVRYARRSRGKNIFITDLNPYKAGLTNFNKGYGFIRDENDNVDHDYPFYFTSINHISPILNIQRIEEKYNIDLSFLSNFDPEKNRNGKKKWWQF